MLSELMLYADCFLGDWDGDRIIDGGKRRYSIATIPLARNFFSACQSAISSLSPSHFLRQTGDLN
jgi:hypothetical protein